MGWFKKRFGEPSTHAGLGLIAVAIQGYLNGGQAGLIQAVITGVLGLGAVVLPEKAKSSDSVNG
jgi:hypothetical protein